ncbi:SNF2 family N-terminal domain-containing protein [Apodospora peruviana]|uniref:SNF2 family N-terminal domain-containing protein n=1 Tax=Apodospora peruviana TaxID=516989 RepID=A0AAE0MCU0_9PEZI|nr:SNF2 family N-terminal domain-containing protein [Apodospora peruviana]
MPRSKVSSRRPKPVTTSGTDVENLAALVELVRSIPPAVDISMGDENEDSGEPPAKRAKTGEHRSAICIARERLKLPVREAALTSDNITVTRRDVGKVLGLHLEKPRQGIDWNLLLFSLAKSRTGPGFRMPFTIPDNELSSRQISALRIADWHNSTPKREGCIWATTDVIIRQEGTAVEWTLEFNIWWNESRSVWGIDQTGSQPTLRKDALKVWYPGLVLQDLPLSWSPQDFYEAAHVPERDSMDPELSAMEIPELQARLYPFQRRAVQWLLEREGVRWCRTLSDGQSGVQPYEPARPSELPISFVKVTDTHGEPFYLSSLFGIATRDISPFLHAQSLRGGVLAEEMGLGKTIEVISLILLHRRLEQPTTILDSYLGQQVLTTSATLIITPSTLLDQWLSELDRHAPALRVLYYPGLKKATKTKDEEVALVKRMAQQDVVITTYETLRSEIWLATEAPQRSMRGEKQYERPKSPLVQLSWWRVCIDEAQMVENWTSNAAILARRIPRVNAWGITGTPVKDNIQKDLRGLLTFLRFEPYASDAKVWKTFTTLDKESFRRLFNAISMRHTKSRVRSEIAIPPQRRYVITMPFTAVEEQHYQNLFQELVATCGLDIYGNPVHDDWDTEDPAVMSAMRVALDRLRQTALHPEVGNRNRRALGQKIGPMRTVAEVLDAMLEQSDSAMRTDQRNLLLLRLTRGQILAVQKRINEALTLWEEVRAASTNLVLECRKQLDIELKEARSNGSTADRQRQGDDTNIDDDREDVVSPRIGEARRRLRSALETQHRAVFFCANAYFSIKSDEEVTEPDSEEFKRLERLEVENYDLAKTIRKEILQESHGKAKKLMDRLAASADQQLFAVIPDSTFATPNGIESRKIVDALEEIGSALDEQANQLDNWREHVIQLLLKPLVDEDNDEITGEEYDESTKLQDEILVFLQVLRAAVADRQATITGQKNGLVDHETKVAIRMALNGEGPSPEKLLQLFKISDAIAPPFAEANPLSSLKGVVSELRGLSVKLRHEAVTGNARAVAELAVVSNLLKLTQSQQTAQAKAANTMEQEVERFTDTLNARLDFYRQLQAVSDMVAEYDGSVDPSATLKQEEALQTKVATAEAKHRYLLHLKEADSVSDEQRICIICQSQFSIGVLTVCGHQFCKECITLWFRAHHNCPMCKRRLHRSNLHDITFKPQELKIHSETAPGGGDNSQHLQNSPTKKTSTIYAEFNPEKLAEIKNIDLGGPCFTTKVDTLIRHLLWLRESDPGAKSIIFSQYKEFLDVLVLAFERYRIGFASFDKAHGVTHFRDDPGTEVFLLHARAHASGLNLVNASHVFLCEPLVNTALELQAIARVDRIGQQHETTVWLYIVDGTVEESIYNLSVQRRLEHMGRNLNGKSKESTPELLDASLDAANSLEMQQAQLTKLMGKNGISGEAVDKKDLWSCLFGHNRTNAQTAAEERMLASNPVTRGFLAAEAAEARRTE